MASPREKEETENESIWGSKGVQNASPAQAQVLRTPGRATTRGRRPESRVPRLTLELHAGFLGEGALNEPRRRSREGQQKALGL